MRKREKELEVYYNLTVKFQNEINVNIKDKNCICRWLTKTKQFLFCQRNLSSTKYIHWESSFYTG